jgi:hypothetical protein
MADTAQPDRDMPVVRRRRTAWAVLATFAATTAFFVAITFSTLKSGYADAPDRGPGDIALYRAEVDRMHDGYGYYDAAEAELRSRGYPTRSLFNWRMPLPMWLIAALGDVFVAKGILALLCLTLAFAAFQLLAGEGTPGEGLLGVALLTGALLPCVLGDLLVLPELWSGVLLALSAVCFGLERRTAGVAAGIAALFFRELAAPYVLICLGLALYERRGRELALWSAGLAAYALFFAVHLSNVLPRISPDDTAHAAGWIRFGGAGFLISTVQMNAYLMLLPQWVTSVYLGCTLVGCWGWRSAAGTRIGLTIVAYAVAFSIVGNDFNQYWGSMIAPLCCLAASRGPRTLARLVRAAWSTQVPVVAPH